MTPEPEWVKYPTLLASPVPHLRACPRETVVAEKYQALVNLGMANTRMKDFYDLWFIARRFGFDGTTLSKAINNTFARRATPLPGKTPSGPMATIRRTGSGTRSYAKVRCFHPTRHLRRSAGCSSCFLCHQQQRCTMTVLSWNVGSPVVPGTLERRIEYRSSPGDVDF